MSFGRTNLLVLKGFSRLADHMAVVTTSRFLSRNWSRLHQIRSNSGLNGDGCRGLRMEGASRAQATVDPSPFEPSRVVPCRWTGRRLAAEAGPGEDRRGKPGGSLDAGGGCAFGRRFFMRMSTMEVTAQRRRIR